MAQQLAMLRTPEAYAGVTAYARSHSGEAAAAAYLALGHAYLLDHRYAEAVENLRLAQPGRQGAGRLLPIFWPRGRSRLGQRRGAEALLHGFRDRYPTASSMVRRRNSKPMFCWR